VRGGSRRPAAEGRGPSTRARPPGLPDRLPRAGWIAGLFRTFISALSNVGSHDGDAQFLADLLVDARPKSTFTSGWAFSLTKSQAT